jgi:alpha-glucosidase
MYEACVQQVGKRLQCDRSIKSVLAVVLSFVVLLCRSDVASATAPITNGLVLHLDASSIVGLSDGAAVSMWTDLSGTGHNATCQSAGTDDKPVYKVNALNGRPVVRFGAKNSWFSFNAITNIRTVFWVCKEDPSAYLNRFLLGHSTYYDFHRGGWNIWDSYWANSRIVNGTTRLNGSVINGTTTAVPTNQYALISLVTTGNVRANQLTRDRDYTDHSWYGDIAEMLVYNRALTTTEINTVESYLNQKYFPLSSTPISYEISSPNDSVVASIIVDGSSHLAFSLEKAGLAVIDKSWMGITVDGTDLGQGVTIDTNQPISEVNETYPWRGLKSKVINHYKTVSFSVTHTQSGTVWTLECRIYDDGFAYRYIVPGSGSRTVNLESTEWVLPPSSYMWYQTETQHYEGYYIRQAPAAITSGTPIGFPVTVELPGGAGYALITEGALDNYSGMTLRSTGTSKLTSTFENRTYYEGAVTSALFTLNGTITSPWRITMAANDLNGLVNCDMVHNVCPPPNPVYYPEGIQAGWIKPGKATWNWWHNGDAANFELQKEYVNEAAELGCQYYVADAGWWGWANSQHNEYYYLGQLCSYAAAKNIEIHVWAALVDYQNASTRRTFFNNLRNAGAAGVKFDFNNSESPYSIQLYKDTLLDAASYNLMINFHGMVKPTGEPRTWPNEITREGVIGLEWDLWDDIPPSHFATTPFTRMVIGHADTTPCTLDPDYLRGTTYAFQIATAVVHNSPLLHWAEQPDLLLASKAVEMIRKIESNWDETIVLRGSQIGSLAAFAKRKGNEWFVGILNGNASSSAQYTLDLSFLDSGQYYAHIIKDDTSNRPEFIVENTTVTGGQQLTVNLAVGGGYIANFSKLALSPLGGWFVDAKSVAVNSLYANSVINYTIDGSEPNASSPQYISPITVNSSCLLRAKIISGDGAGHETRGWFKIIPPAPPMPDVYLSDLNWISETAGWGPPKKDFSVQNNALRVAGSTYSKGIGTHADSEIIYNIQPGYSRFVAKVGIDDEITLDKASIVFSVVIDGITTAASPVIRHDGSTEFWHFNVAISPGSQQLKIVSSATNDGIDYDHADWVNAGFILGYDFYDLMNMADHWLETGCTGGGTCGGMDLDNSGLIDFTDFTIVADDWINIF